MVVGVLNAPDGEWTILEDVHRIARLGEGLDASGSINQGAVERASAILRDYKLICEALRVESIAAVGTSALRNANNGVEVRKLLETQIGVPIDVIGGLEEANITFAGVAGKFSKPCTVIDIGGGSSEYISGFSRIVYSAHSVEFGAVRFTERFGLGDLPTRQNVCMARDFVQRELASVKVTLRSYPNEDLIAVAGTPTSLAILDLGLTKFEKEKVDGHVLQLGAISYWTERLLEMSRQERSTLPGIDPNRVDILPAGALILEQSLRDLDYDRCLVSVKGLRFGVMMR